MIMDNSEEQRSRLKHFSYKEDNKMLNSIFLMSQSFLKIKLSSVDCVSQ